MKQLSMWQMVGYSVGATGDYIAYGFIFNFLSFYLTTVAGIDPVVAGGIISIAVVWDAITDPIVGLFTESVRSKRGKRRAVIKTSVAPLGASVVLLFTNVGLESGAKTVYYALMVLLFWTFYTLWNIPYYSLGSAITSDDEQRTKISGIRQVTGFIGTFVATSVPTFLVGQFVAQGLSQGTAWLYVALLVASVIVVTILIMLRSTRGVEPIDEDAPKRRTLREAAAEILSVLRMKSYLVIVAAALFTNTYMALFFASILYFASFNLGLTETQSSALYTVQTFTSIALVPFLTKAALKFDKRIVYTTAMSFSGLVMIGAKFVGIEGYVSVLIYMGLASVGPAAYWMFIFNFLYDVVDVNEQMTGKRHDGVIMSFYSFLLKLGGALASFVLGVLLSRSGFDGETATQTESARAMIESLFTILPGIFLLLAGVVMIASPLTLKYMTEVYARRMSNGETGKDDAEGIDDDASASAVEEESGSGRCNC